MRSFIALNILLCICAGCDGGGTDPDAGDTAQEPDAGDDTTVADTVADTTPQENECAADTDCDDSDPCTTDRCDLSDGTCVSEAVDTDADGFPAASVDGTNCGGTDCDDSDDAIYPGAPLDCTSGLDFDCDTLPDVDEDADGYMTDQCGGDDCDDSDEDAFPGSTVIECESERDRDCNGHPDDDNDGDDAVRQECGGGDCDDLEPAIHPGIVEAPCDGVDSNCDGVMDDYEDADYDGYANELCAAEGDPVDCDDDEVTINPGATEICDEVDQDCDGSWADGGADDDLDGHLDEACGGDDCDDTDDTVYEGAPEICLDGIDQDCDGSVDGFTLMEITPITSTAVAPDDLTVTWSGSEFALLWADDRTGRTQAWFARAGASGAPIGAETQLTDDLDYPWSPSLTWSGSRHGVSWAYNVSSMQELYFLALHGDGTTAVSPRKVDSAIEFVFSEAPMVYTGTEFLSVYHSVSGSTAGFRSTRIGDDGTDVGATTQLMDWNDSVRDVEIVQTSTGAAACWQKRTSGGLDTIDLVFLDDTGSVTAGPVHLTTWETDSPALAWTGSEVAIAWMDHRTGDTYIDLARYTTSGTQVGSTQNVADGTFDATSLDMAWTGSEFFIAYLRGGELYLNFVSPTGTEGTSFSGSAIYTAPAGSDIDMAWTGSIFGIGWMLVSGGAQVTLSTAGFCD